MLPRLRGNLRDLGDSIAQVDLDTDSIALGDMLLVQHVGVANRQRPGPSFLRSKSDRPFGLIDADNGASAKGGRGFADENRAADHAEETKGHDYNLEWLHGDTSGVMVVSARQYSARRRGADRTSL